MKTKEQIIEWLDKQPWKNEFYENCVKYGAYPTYDGDFIITAFDYELTAQGNEVWSRRSVEYAKWYSSNDKPMSWKEYCEQNPIKGIEFFIDAECNFEEVSPRERIFRRDANVMSNKLCKAFLAYMKLIQLRNAWVKDCTDCVTFAKITTIHNSLTIMIVGDNTNGLSFYSKDMAQEFLDTFKDLLETAKPLL